jgi:hypothetical protein
MMHEPESTRATLTCPSAPAEEGSALFGVVAAKGQVAYITPKVPYTSELLTILGQSGVPMENRLRFSGPCLEHRCVQWEGTAGSGRCGLVDHAIETLHIEADAETLPKCDIRQTCRWYAQHRGKACAACPEVIRRPQAE